jgi:hypothetical protein
MHVLPHVIYHLHSTDTEGGIAWLYFPEFFNSLDNYQQHVGLPVYIQGSEAQFYQHWTYIRFLLFVLENLQRNPLAQQ